eukprot:6323577-Prymnesium_polylepis.1
MATPCTVGAVFSIVHVLYVSDHILCMHGWLALGDRFHPKTPGVRRASRESHRPVVPVRLATAACRVALGFLSFGPIGGRGGYFPPLIRHSL